MLLSSIVDAVAEDLERTASLGNESVQQAAQLLAGALSNSVKVRFLEGLEQAAAELSDEMPGTSVEVRMHGGEPVLSLTVAETGALPVPAGTPEAPGEDEGETARITLRLPERLKSQVEAAAQHDGVSVNTWLVEAAAQAVRGASSGSFPGGPGGFPGPGISWSGSGRRGPKRVTGFVRG